MKQIDKKGIGTLAIVTVLLVLQFYNSWQISDYQNIIIEQQNTIIELENNYERLLQAYDDLRANNYIVKQKGEFHYYVTAIVTKADGTKQILAWCEENVFTNIGKDWVEGILGDAVGADVAKYIALSNTNSTPSATWTKMTGEYTTNGLDRQTGTYASTGTGTWTIIKTFTCTGGSNYVKCTGLHWVATDDSDNNMIAVVAFTTPATLANGDTLQVTWSNSVSSIIQLSLEMLQ